MTEGKNKMQFSQTKQIWLTTKIIMQDDVKKHEHAIQLKSKHKKLYS